MSVLLRQPHGFEGPGVIPEVLLADDLGRANGVDDGLLQVHDRAATCTLPDVPHNHSITRFNEADRFRCIVGIPPLPDLRKQLHDRIPTSIGTRLMPTLGGLQDHVGRVQLTKCVHVSCVPGLEGGPHSLHVLLRHRPRSIAQAQESA